MDFYSIKVLSPDEVSHLLSIRYSRTRIMNDEKIKKNLFIPMTTSFPSQQKVSFFLSLLTIIITRFFFYFKSTCQIKISRHLNVR